MVVVELDTGATTAVVVVEADETVVESVVEAVVESAVVEADSVVVETDVVLASVETLEEVLATVAEAMDELEVVVGVLHSAYRDSMKFVASTSYFAGYP